MRGRKPKPSRLKALAGNPGKRPLKKREPKAPPAGGAAAEIKCPDHLDKLARLEWQRMEKLLTPAGLLTAFDTGALAAYCAAFSRWVQSEKEVHESGTVIKSPSGYPVQNPYLAVANKAMKQMKEFMAEFGLTPSSRSRIQLSETPAANELEEFNQPHRA